MCTFTVTTVHKHTCALLVGTQLFFLALLITKVPNITEAVPTLTIATNVTPPTTMPAISPALKGGG